MTRKVRLFGFALLAALWLALILGAWFGPTRDISDSERRKLAQMPEITVDSILSGNFMTKFEDFSLDQFPLRDTFRQLKARFHYNVLRQGDNNNIYVADGYAAKLEYPLNETSLSNAVQKFNHIYKTYLTDSENIVFAAVPDKGYYLGEANGYPVMDYEKLFNTMKQEMPWATFADLTDVLDVGDYYFTDTHWRQEQIGDAADKLCEALGVDSFAEEELTLVKVDRPFYGVYYGQAALPMEAEDLYVMTGEVLDNCRVYNHETGATTGIYDWEKLSSRDLYDIYLSGAAALLTIENPNAATDKELVVFRDSFGSSMVPLLLKDYRTVTVVDIRYVASDWVGQYVDFHGQDVLFLYSTLILNSSNTLK
jgi:hypothetical protein